MKYVTNLSVIDKKTNLIFFFKHLILYITFLLFKQFCKHCICKTFYRNGSAVTS